MIFQIEEAILIDIVHYILESNSEKNSIETSVEYAVAYEKIFKMLKYADIIMVEYCERKQGFVYG